MSRILPFALAAALCLSVPAFAVEPPPIDALVRDLRSVKPEQRAKAAEGLGQLGPLAAPAVKGLVSALTDTSVEVQLEALMALEHIGPAARGAVPELVAILKDPKSPLQAGAIEALGAIGRDAQEAVPLLLNFLNGDDLMVTTAAGGALARILPADRAEIKQAVPVLIKSLKAKNPGVRNDAVVGLGFCGKAAVPALVDLVKGHATNAELAWQAAAALSFMGPTAQPAAPALVEALGSKNEKVVNSAADALSAIGPEAKGAVPQFRKLLTGSNASIRVHVANALGDLGPLAEPAIPELTKTLKDSNENVRRESALALGKIGPAAKPAIGALVAALSDDSGAVTVQAAGALGRIGPDVVPQLVAAVKDPKTQHLAVMILGQLGPAGKPAAGALAGVLAGYDKELSDEDREFCREIILGLAHMGPDAKEAAAPTLMKILSNEKHELRPGAGWALAKMGAKEAVPILKKALETDDNSRLHFVAPMALMLLEPTHEEYVKLAVPRLIESLDNKIPLIRREAAATIGLVGAMAADAVPKLGEKLDDPDPAVRNEILSTLAAIGPKAVAVLPAILKQLSDVEPPVRYSASYAIGRIGPAAVAAVPLLEKNLAERDEFLQAVSAWALVHVAPPRDGVADQCVTALVRAIKYPDPRTRNEAVVTLAMMGPSASAATKALKNIAQDPDETVRKSVVDALKKIAK